MRDDTNNDAQPIALPIDRLRAYDKNPRHGDNPEYARIKASIRTHGLDQPLIVTQRPDETDYVLHTGGNTRLKILRELFDETGDTRFAEAPCLVRPWAGEVDVLLAHLRENDLRGALTFIDKALAVDQARRLLEASANKRRVTQTALTEALRARGYALSPALVCQMTYAVERLLPVIPQALHGGMGRPQVERIRQLERAARALWCERLPDDEAEFEPTFDALCQRHDSPDWELAGLRRSLEAELAERAETSIHAIGLHLEQALSGRSDQGNVVEGHEDDVTDDARPAPVSSNDRVGAERNAATKVVGGVPPGKDARQADKGGTETREPEAAPDHHPTAQPSANAPVAEAPSDAEQSTRTGDIKSLRARAWTLASRLAQRNGLSELIQPLSSDGLGYVVTDVPDSALVDQLDDDALAQVSMVWWHLAAAAEMTVASLDHLLPHLDETSVLTRALTEQDAGLLFSSVWTLDPGHTGYRLWRRLGERDWQDLRDLMANYRALYRTADATGVRLWQ